MRWRCADDGHQSNIKTTSLQIASLSISRGASLCRYSTLTSSTPLVASPPEFRNRHPLYNLHLKHTTGVHKVIPVYKHAVLFTILEDAAQSLSPPVTLHP